MRGQIGKIERIGRGKWTKLKINFIKIGTLMLILTAIGIVSKIILIVSNKQINL